MTGRTTATMHAAVTMMAAFMLGATATAQSRQIPAPAQSGPVVLAGATVHPISGPALEEGWIVFDDGVITAMGTGQAPTIEGANLMNVTGLHVYPGLVAASSGMGLTETGAVDVTHDHDEYGSITPEVRAVIAVNPDSDHIPVARANGVLTVQSMPTGGVVSGRSSIIRMDGWTNEDLTIDDAAGLVVNWPRAPRRWSGGRGGRRGGTASTSTSQDDQLRAIDKLFDDAERYLAAREADPSLPSDLRFDAMAATIAGDSPVWVRATSAAQIESAIAWALRRDLPIVIVGGHEAPQVAELLVEHEVPVVVTSIHRLPRRRDDRFDEAYTLPARLHDAGVTFCIASGSDSSNERNLPYHAATAAAYGLPVDQALRAVTMTPAQVMGIGDSHGTLEPGKSATLIVTTGNPLELTSNVVGAYIDGRAIDLGSRHKALWQKYVEKYRQLDRID